MAKEPEILFEIDASKILAKLHLGGLQPCTYDKNTEFIVNTGILNDDPNAKPENPGKVTFDLTNSQLQYEVGFVTKLGPFKKSIGIISVVEQITPLLAKFKTEFGDKDGLDDIEDTSLLSKDELKKKRDELRQAKKDHSGGDYDDLLDAIMDILDKNDEALLNSGFDVDKFIIEQLKVLNAERKKNSPTATDAKKLTELTNAEFIVYADALIAKLQELGKNDVQADDAQDEYNEEKEKARAHAIEQLTLYLTAFLGKNGIDKFKQNDVIMINISDKVKDSNDKSLIQNYEINSIPDVEREKQKKQFETDPENCVEKVCFKTGYTLQIDK